MTFNDMCNYTHELLTSLGYTYKVEANFSIFKYYLGDNELFTIFCSITQKSVWKKVGFDSPWYQIETNEAGEYEPYYINELSDIAKKFVKLYKQTKVDSRKKEIEKDFHND